jgi:hypothetical protein
MGKPVAVGYPKHEAAGKVSQHVKLKGKQRKNNAPPVPSEADPSSSGTTFPIGPCCLGVNCVDPKLKLRKHYLLCEGWFYVPCG